MLFSIPVLVAIAIAILALVLIMEPENLKTGAVENKMIRNEFRSSKHKWEKSEMKSFYFCYLCQKLTNGWFSDVLECKKCGIIIHKICRYLKLRKPECKYIVAKKSDSKFHHQWRQCSYSSNSDCLVCQTVCVGLESYVCIWCHRSRHGFCSAEEQECDFGPMRKFILEPTEVKCESAQFTMNAFTSLKKNYKKIKEKTSESEEQPMKDEDLISINVRGNKRPVVVVINKKSGGQTGNEFIKAFYQLLNPLQVISILDEGLEKLKLFTKVPNIFFVIAGGDGTICSVINYIKTIPEWTAVNPPAAVLPLGTGNDLSRSLGWGGTMEDVNPAELIQKYNSMGKTELLDRWAMTISREGEVSEEYFTVYNYFGIGLDAKICKSFHEMREKHPELFFSQFSNKIIYSQMGLADMLAGKKLALHELVEIRVDGQKLEIEDYENVIFLNIKHWGGGVTDLWRETAHDRQFGPQSICDGKIEVIGLTDLIHMGQVQVGLDEPFQLAQGEVVEIRTVKAGEVVPLQIDGEPLDLVSPFTIRIRRKDQAYVLATEGSFSGKISKILTEGLKENIISEEQLSRLSKLAHKISL